MKAIIVDDEPKAIELIQGYLKNFSAIEVAATFRNGLKAFEYLTSHQVELIFLDINMPHISGISLSKMIDKEIKLIFTTAHSEYAVESYDVAATDYLLKPITLERFVTAMSKVLEPAPILNDEDSKHVWLRSGGRDYKVPFDSILYLYKEGNYITYFSKEFKVVARESMAESLAKLPSFFCQVHKSYIINTKLVTSMDRNSLYFEAIQIPLGSTYREHVLPYFKNMGFLQ